MAKAVAVEDQQSNSGLERIKAQPRQLAEFLKDVRSEMRKVVTPTRTEVVSTTSVVLATVAIFAAYFFMTDFVFGQGITQLIQHLTKR
ncbi:MAG TPA: preprotein translocase subunit SecE [Acidobacteriaceae bacterium]|jgi:preprotein translocase subunit SecE